MSSPRTLWLVDGPSGSGKSDWASHLARESGFLVVSLDEVYPGWDGLDAGARLTLEQVVTPWVHGEDVSIPQWDWGSARWGAPRALPRDGEGLIVEGCGAITPRAVAWASEVWWVDADPTLRRTRALQRDGERFAPYWTRWALQEERFFHAVGSPGLATRHLVT